MMKTRLSFLLFFLFFSVSIFAQNDSIIQLKEDSIRLFLIKIKTSENDSDKLSINNSISRIFKEILILPECFSYPFDSLSYIGKITSPDNIFRIISWNIILLDGTNTYYGFIITRKNNNNTVQIYELKDKAFEIQNPERSVLSAGKWFGGLYYKILMNKIDHISYYTLFSLRYNDLFTTSKILDILFFDEFSNPVFGAPLFEQKNETKLRVVFEYSSNVSMNLNYNNDLKMIVFDHLSPKESIYTGQFQYYGPDFSYDGYQMKDKRWKLVTDLNIKQPANISTPQVKRKPGSNKVVH